MAPCGLQLLFLIVAAASAEIRFPTLAHLRPAASDEEQTEAVQELCRRLLGSRAGDFVLTVKKPRAEAETFELRSLPDGRVSVLGSSGVAAASGLYSYLRDFCGCHVSWSGRQLDLPTPLPRLPGPLWVTAPNRFRYYQNVCVYSYSFVWWNWERWEKEIDWMALSGINLALAFTGQEAIWQRVYLSLGLTQAEIDSFFVGPAYLAWERMGNMHSWAGPLSYSWNTNQLNLQHQILQRMRSLGMLPVLPAFAGFVPAAFNRLFPKENVTRLGNWGNLNCSYSCSYLLDSESPFFQQIGKMFQLELIQEFGTDHVYSADTFNEMTPRSSDPKYLSSISNAVFKSMTQVDRSAIWLMQGWLFMSGFWRPAQVKALLHGVPLGRMIILDLFADSRPAYLFTESFYGQPFIWCMLHNFGGNTGMYGTVETINRGPFEARAFPNSTMVGTGITPEGIEQNDVVYELMNEIGWRKEPLNLSKWVTSYAQRRYGKKNDGAVTAWLLLFQSVYNNTFYRPDHNRSPLVHRPSLKLDTSLWYNKSHLYEAWKHMQMAVSELYSSETFRYDLVDVTRQSVQLLTSEFYEDLKLAFLKHSLVGLQTLGNALIHNLLPDLDDLLSSDRHFLLGHWLETARSLAATEKDANLYEFNARNQITLWGPNGNLLDYANKQWGGLINDYYAPRWELFVSTLIICLDMKIPFNQAHFNQISYKVEQNFTINKVKYPDKPLGNTIEIAKKMFLKYYPQAMKIIN
ncbi:alpha-N-acetylglucosaminidase isoform X1 [Amblyraja radiata]|uniref:alpha-N-acetylglucosaminidase isoform X1 n=1 Tax=Amblyraja radiata TaxID=386614 RepID=UPI0014032187|nr:alpha-N-acetylglucosaminidase isoform X1 [Amblyraja radiata]XP_032890694.1 alpha-N-acetylglucosaminidase isoform X1 [Amblyraja radiata]